MDKFIGMLGMCKRANLLCSGEFAVMLAIKNSQAKLIIIASDASKNTVKKFTNSANFYNVKYIIKESKETLGNAIGEEFRAVICIKDEGFCKKLLSFGNDK